MTNTITVPYSSEDMDGIRQALMKSHRTIAVAESVTAGLLQNAFSLATDARLFFQGGMTVYNVAQKCRQLHIEPIQAQQDNGVSERVAIQLATHITRIFCSQLGIAIVGYASPVPEKGVESPFAWFAIYGDERLLKSGRLDGIEGGPMDNQVRYVRGVIAALVQILGQ